MNLVLTSVYGLSAQAVEPFFSSLRHSGYEDPVVVFATNISEDCRSLLKQYGAVVFEPEYTGFPLAYASLSKRLTFVPTVIYRAYVKQHKNPNALIVNCWRYFCFSDYLAQLTSKPNYVLFSDVRDVVFQKQPFSFPFELGLSVASECVRSTIGNSRANSKWLWQAAGFKQMRKLANQTPICSGTTVADYRTALSYLTQMTSLLKKAYFWGLFEAIDQGLHNYIVHNQLIEPLHIFRNWSSPFLTLDSEEVLSENKDSAGYICNQDRSIVPIVHQYDRVRNLYKPGEIKPPCWRFVK